MTRKKAIEAALDEAMLIMEAREVEPSVDDAGRFYRAAMATYQSGRIAGLREAARMAANYKNRRAMQPDQFAAAEAIEGMVSDHARALAKKRK